MDEAAVFINSLIFRNEMKRTIKTTNFTYTSEIADYLEKKLGAIEKYVDPADTSAILDIEIGKTTNHHNKGDIFKAEANLHAHPNIDVRSEVEKESLNAAIDALKDELINTLRTKKHKRINFLRRSGAKLKDMLRGFGTKA